MISFFIFLLLSTFFGFDFLFHSMLVSIFTILFGFTILLVLFVVTLVSGRQYTYELVVYGVKSGEWR